ncbi:unnamed protein product, partial [Heterotrigona itama]
RLLEVLKQKNNNRFYAKYTSEKLKVMFQNIIDFNQFKEHIHNVAKKTYTISTEKILSELTPLNCTFEIPIHTKYPIYRVTFAPGMTLAKVSQIRFIESILGNVRIQKTNHTMLPLSDTRTLIHKL